MQALTKKYFAHFAIEHIIQTGLIKTIKRHYVHIWMFSVGNSKGQQKMAPACQKRLPLTGSHISHPQLKAPSVFCLSCLKPDVTYNQGFFSHVREDIFQSFQGCNKEYSHCINYDKSSVQYISRNPALARIPVGQTRAQLISRVTHACFVHLPFHYH